MTKLQQAIIFINYFSLGIIIPVLNLILLERGASLQTLPILMALYAVTVLCFELPSGICADLYGRKTVFLISCGFQLLSLLLLLMANNILLLIFVIVFNGLSRSFASGSLDALIIDQALAIHGDDSLSKTTSRLAILEESGVAVGSIAGGIISYIGGTNNTNIVLRGILIAAILILCIIYVKEIPCHEGEEKRIPLLDHLKEARKIVFAAPKFKLIFAGVFFIGFLLITIETYWQSAFMGISKLPNSTWALGIITFLGFIAAASGNSIANKLLGKFRSQQWRVYNICRIMLAVCIVVFAVQNNSAGFIFGYIMIYLILGTGNVAENTLINRYTPNHMRASILSLSSFITQIGVMFASLFSSIMIRRLHFSGLWIVTGILLGGYALFVTIITYQSKTGETDILSSDE